MQDISRSHWISRLPERNINFVGMVPILQAIQDGLSKSKFGSTNAITLAGGTGSGKTECIKEYIYSSIDIYDYVFWICCDTTDTIWSGFTELATQLGLESSLSGQQLVTAVKDELFSLNHGLLVFDNATDYESVHEFLPRNIQCLISSQHTEWSNLIKLNPFRTEDTQHYFEQISPVSPSFQQCAYAQLCQELDGLPLSIVHAAHFIVQESITIVDYLRLLAVDQTNTNHQGATQLTLQRTQRDHPLAYQFHAFLSVLPDLPLPRHAITGWLEEFTARSSIQSDASTKGAMHYLVQHSLVTANPYNLKLHQLIRGLHRQSTSAKSRQQINSTVISQMLSYFRVGKIYQPELLNFCIQTIYTLLGDIRTFSDTNIDELGLLLTESSEYFHHVNIQSFPAVESALHHVIAHYQKEGKRESDVAMAQKALAIVQRETGKQTEALDNFTSAKEILTRLYSEESIFVAGIKSRMGNLLRDIGQIDTAIEYLNSALNVQRTEYGENDLHVALTYNDLGKAQRDSGDYAAADQSITTAKAIHERVCTRGVSVDYARCLGNLGTVKMKQDDFSAAISHFEHALQIQNKLYLTLNRSQARTMLNLAYAHYHAQHYDDARHYLDMAEQEYQIIELRERSRIGEMNSPTTVEDKLRLCDTLRNWLDTRSIPATNKVYCGYTHFDTDKLKDALESMMTTDIICDGDLTIGKLASQLSETLDKSVYNSVPASVINGDETPGTIKSHQLSQFINQYYEKNFRQFLNEYRVRQAQGLLLEKPHLSSQRIGSMVGFYSEAAFINAFKIFAHTTPGQFRRAQLQVKK